MGDKRDTQLVTIRKAEHADIDQVCELLFSLKTMYGSCAETTVVAFREQYAPAICAALQSPENSIWVAQTRDGTLAGFLSTTRRLVLRLAGEVGALEEIFIRPAYRRRGVAYRLWESAIADLRAHGVKTVEVVTSLAHPGQRQFAKKLGLEWYASIHRVQL